MTREFTDGDAAWLDAHVHATLAELRSRLDRHRETADIDRLLRRIEHAREAVLHHGWLHMSGLEEAHNEVCVALGILGSGPPPVALLRYEPKLAGTEKTIDFVVEYAGGRLCYVDVKTIGPESRDRWEQYARAQEEGWFPDRSSVILVEEWMGGELWHNKVAARSRMLEYTLELEVKAAAADLPASDPLVLVLCSNGFHWHEDELEDFVDFYVRGTHRPDDPLSKMEQKHLESHPLPAVRRVARFAYLERSSGAILPSRLRWHVAGPRFPLA